MGVPAGGNPRLLKAVCLFRDNFGCVQGGVWVSHFQLREQSRWIHKPSLGGIVPGARKIMHFFASIQGGLCSSIPFDRFSAMRSDAENCPSCSLEQDIFETQS